MNVNEFTTPSCKLVNNTFVLGRMCFIFEKYKKAASKFRINKVFIPNNPSHKKFDTYNQGYT